MAYFDKLSSAKRKLSYLYFCIVILLLFIISSCNIYNTYDPKAAETDENLNYAHPISTQSILDSSISSDSVSIQPDVPVRIFSLSNAHHTAPEDVLGEVLYPGEAGGGSYCDLEGSPDGPTIVESNLENSANLGWRARTKIFTCGWQPGETVDLIIKNGFGERVFNCTFDAAENGGVTVDLCCANCDECFPELNTPYGSYSLTLEGGSGELERIIHVEKPQEAQVYRNDTQLILYNFQPNEKGRIFLYNESLIEKSDLLRANSMSGLTAWDEFQVDGSGQLILEIEKGTNPEKYFLIGNSSGEVHVPFDWGTINNILCSPKVKVIFPTYADLRNVNSLWDLAHYRDLREPGTQTYNIEVRSADKWRWGFSWCAIDSDTLFRIEFPLSIQFFIDDIELSDHAPQIVEESQTTSNGWECSRWSIILANWESNSQVKLEVRYSLSESIFDGEETYPAGEYHQVIYVDVRE